MPDIKIPQTLQLRVPGPLPWHHLVSSLHPSFSTHPRSYQPRNSSHSHPYPNFRLTLVIAIHNQHLVFLEFPPENFGPSQAKNIPSFFSSQAYLLYWLRVREIEKSKTLSHINNTLASFSN